MFRLRNTLLLALPTLAAAAFGQTGVGVYQVTKGTPTADSLGFAPIYMSGGASGMTWDPTLRDNIIKAQVAAADVLMQGPRYDVRNPDAVRLGGCANAADPSNVTDSTCAINYAFTVARTKAAALTALHGGNMQPVVVYLPTGHYHVSGTITLNQGEALLGDAKIGTVLQQTDPNLALILYQKSPIYNDSYAPYSLVQGMTVSGSGHATVGNLIEGDAGYLLLRDVNFFNTGGRGVQYNVGERDYGENLSFYNVRYPMILSGDDNESTFVNTDGLGNAVSNESASGSTYGNYCYGENCTNGVFPAANQGASGAPTPLVVPSRGAIHIEKAVNVAFLGGDMKDNQFIAAIKNFGGINIKVSTFYAECSNYTPWACMTPAIINGGRAEKTTITGSLTAGSYTVGGSTVNYHTATVSNSSWMSSHYSSLAALQSAVGSGGNYQPFVIVPSDFNRASTSASTSCPGINQNQFEIASSGHFYDATGTPMILLFDAQRNGYQINHGSGGVYNSTSNPTGVPSLYNWGACTTPPLVEDYMGGASAATLSIEDFHSNTVQGGALASGAIVQNGYSYSAPVGSENSPGEWIVGLTPDDSPNGFFTKELATGDPLATMGTTAVNIKQPIQMFNGANPFIGQITVVRNATISVEGGLLNPAATANEPNAITPLANGSQQISLIPLTGGSHIVAAPNGQATPAAARLEVTAPNIGEVWIPNLGIFQRHVGYFDPYQQTGSYTYGDQFQNDINIFSAFGGTNGLPNMRFHCHGYPANDAPFCSFDFGRSAGSWTSGLSVSATAATANAPLVAAGGLTRTYRPIAGNYSILPGDGFVSNYNPGGTSIETLPTCGTQVGYGWSITLIQQAPGTISLVSQDKTFYLNGVGYGTTYTWPTVGAFSVECEQYGWRNISDVPYLGSVSVTVPGTNALGTSPTAPTASASSSAKSAVYSWTEGTSPASAKGTALFTVTFSPSGGNAPKFCEVVPLPDSSGGSNAALARLDLYVGNLSSSGYSVYINGTALPASAPYVAGVECQVNN